MNSTDRNETRVPWITATVVGLSIAAFLTGFDPAFEFRLVPHTVVPSLSVFTCHLAHYSASHHAWSLGAFALLGAICELRDRLRFCLCLITSAVAIPIALSILQPALHRYRGISGIDSGLFFLLAVSVVRTEAPTRPLLARAAVVPMAAFIAKMLFEQLTQSAVFTDSTAANFVPAPIAHITGAFIGTAVAMTDSVRRYRPSAIL